MLLLLRTKMLLLLLLAGGAWLLISQRKATETLEMRLRGVSHAVYGLGEAQKDSDEAAAYLDRTDPEGAISALQGRITRPMRRRTSITPATWPSTSTPKSSNCASSSSCCATSSAT